MKKSLMFLASFAIAGAFAASAMAAEDHSQHLKGPFASGPEVTKACLECHPDAATDIMKTTHWTWTAKQKLEGKGEVDRGKKNVINNYCVSLSANEPRCTSCHIGYGWKDASFDFTDKTKVDCLVCHDTSKTYKKDPKGAGNPVEGTDLLKAAQSVGKPTRDNCGACHFFGGGGDAVKHGDMDSSQKNPSRELDVHLSKMTCQECHKTMKHDIKGSAFVVGPANKNGFNCEECHKDAPHKDADINKHAARVACQTCHIPEFARAQPTKMNWDWSTAGQDVKDPPKDANGKPTYDKMKGSFVWEKNVVPTYAWYNGTSGAYLLGEKMDPAKVTQLSYPNGSKADAKARIYPFKLHKGKQPYDSKNNYFVTPHLFGKGGYWASYDWKSAIESGMKASNLPFSGEFAFAETEMYWPLNHMVAPKDKALSCDVCHGEKGRLDWKALGYEGNPKK